MRGCMNALTKRELGTKKNGIALYSCENKK